jgi:ribonucleoside-diphosphate reductase alpha chain
MIILKRSGSQEQFNISKMKQFITNMVNIVPVLYSIDIEKVVNKLQTGLSDSMSSEEILSYTSDFCAGMGTESYDYSLLAGRITTISLYNETPSTFTEAMNQISHLLDESFLKKVADGIDYDSHIIENNDFQYDILGIKTLMRSYLLKDEQGYVERPQYMLMRVALFLCDVPEEVIETYHIMSKGLYTHASPTLFHCGMKQHQLASCFLMTMKEDSIAGIYDSLKDTALISKSAGGIGISVSNIRAKGSSITGTNGTSNGLVPMLRVFNDTARYCDQGGGKRKGSFAIFIEPWHADIFDVLSLKLNHGLEEERARDLFYSLFIPDLFMECVEEDKDWYLFCPNDVPELQNSYGESFNRIYNLAVSTKQYRQKVKARLLWNKIIATQIETGTPYLVYKDACNVKSNQRHLGTIKSSNLCAEIVEYSAPDETAVCTLASIALPKHVGVGGFDFDKLMSTAMVVTRNLNHVVDKTSYPVKAAETSNMRHRPLGLGVQGLADVFQMMGLPYGSEEAKKLNHDIFETIYYGATRMSIELAKLHGVYKSYPGSPSSNGQFNFDLWNHTPSSRWDWAQLRQEMKQHGMRNSLLVALMPTASSASILGNTESFEPRTSNLYVRRVLSGEFMIMNKYLERACKKRNLWNKKLRDDLIKNRGSVLNTNLPKDMKNVFKTVWEMSQKTLIDLSRGRAPYVCQSQSLNLYQSSPTPNSLNSMHFYAWRQGLKTGQYYLRTQPKAMAIAFTVDNNKVAEEVGYKRPKSGITIYSKSQCNYCDKLKEKIPEAYVINCDDYLEEVDDFLDFIATLTDKNPTSFPMVFHDGEFVGGYKEASNLSGGECISCSA